MCAWARLTLFRVGLVNRIIQKIGPDAAIIKQGIASLQFYNWPIVLPGPPCSINPGFAFSFKMDLFREIRISPKLSNLVFAPLYKTCALRACAW